MNTCTSVGVAALILLLTVQQCVSFTCYICSWSPSSQNRTDICTIANFSSEKAKVFDGCSHGCESVATYDTNGQLENFYRNCVVKGNTRTNDCRDEMSAATKKNVCRCYSDLCNEATSPNPGPFSALAVALLSTLAAALATFDFTVY